ncbi:Outer membrane protein/protective antigen OMA87 [Luteitalea pratensis]|uniref:Outer membrane protein/protective antigen OMA87 n=1 Tax=Luteitalea pratensis TaxID=1855912 RepID=A0A143PKC3_LUTPR|nr:BamA/TamA family outer membrane protein [Luteitalea pratensis]AMY08997.1 Outer membrane protein/protective antigen OMA87 [Luteitalea pratensis]
MIHAVTGRLAFRTIPRGRTGVAALVVALGTLAAASGVRAQPAPADGETRAGTIEAQQQEKAGKLAPYEPNGAEMWVKKLEEMFLSGNVKWHPFFTSAYGGGGFTLGAGYLAHVRDYDTLDVRGSYTFSNYKRIETEYVAPRLFGRRARLSVLGGWREAPQVNFFGVGNDSDQDAGSNYGFRQPYVGGLLEVRPTRGALFLAGGTEFSQWDQFPGEGGDTPTVGDVYGDVNGLNAKVTYLHSQATVAIDTRLSPEYARRGGYYGVTLHHYGDQDDAYTFEQVNYEAVQHIPILRDAWVLSLRGRVETTMRDNDDQVPFFMLPGLGSGSNLRGYQNLRFRDRHSLLMQAEWRVLVNSFIDTAIFFDAGKVAARKSDLDFKDLHTDFGIGFRLHGPLATPVRIELAKGSEGFNLVFAASASF